MRESIGLERRVCEGVHMTWFTSLGVFGVGIRPRRAPSALRRSALVTAVARCSCRGYTEAKTAVFTHDTLMFPERSLHLTIATTAAARVRHGASHWHAACLHWIALVSIVLAGVLTRVESSLVVRYLACGTGLGVFVPNTFGRCVLAAALVREMIACRGAVL